MSQEAGPGVGVEKGQGKRSLRSLPARLNLWPWRWAQGKPGIQALALGL